jgi:exodeoxyribonuclease-3
MRTRARERNAGWRIDYFLLTQDLTPRLRAATIEMDVTGSDHAPVVLELA